MQHPNLSHRIMPAGGELADFSGIDFYSTVVGKIEDIRALSDIMRTQYDPGSDVVIGDEVNLNLMRQIDQHLSDLDAMAEWIVNNFKIVPEDESEATVGGDAADYYQQDHDITH